MKGLLFLALVGAAIYGAIVLSYNLLPHDPAENVSTRPSLGNPDDRQLRSWGTDLPALASSSSQGAGRMGQGCLRRESAWRRLYFLPDAPLLSARHRITGRRPTKRLGPDHRPNFWRARLGIRAISRAGRRSHHYTNRNGYYPHSAGG